MNRIVIVGCSGSGKSTLAQAMSTRLELPVVHMDVLYWRRGWRPIDDEDMRSAVNAAAGEQSWIIEGLAIAASGLRFQRAQMIVWLDLPILTCLRRVIFRAIKDHGRTRADLPEGCPEKIDLKFYWWVWRFDRDVRPRLEAALKEFGRDAELVRLRTDKEVASFISSLPGAIT